MKRFTVLLAFFMLMGFALQAQNVQITGNITGADDESALPGVSVVVKGTTIGTVTDYEGNYSLSVPANASTLIFSFVGMATQEVEIGNKSLINVVLELDMLGLDEVVVTAYGTATKSSFTGAATTVNAETIERRQVADISNALTGVTSGIQVSSDDGQPGSAARIRIRGVGSLSASSAPLYVVDGIPYGEDISAINTQDIETVTVLKDASSASLYGARGANGVIMITTKKGKSGKLDVSFSARRGINQRSVPEYDIMTEPGMYYEKYYEGIYNDQYGAGLGGLTAAEANTNVNTLLLGDQGVEYNIYNVPSGQNLVGIDGKMNPNATLGRTWATDYKLINDDWYGELFGTNQIRDEYNLSLAGGNEKQTTFLSLNYLNDEGIISNSGFKRLSARLNSDYQVKDWLKIGGNLSYSNTETRYPDDQFGLSSKNLFYVSRIVAPIYPLYVRDNTGEIIVDDLGHTLYDYGTGEYPGLTRPIMSIANPASDLALDVQRYNTDVLTTKVFAQIDIIEGLRLTLNAAYDLDNTRYLDKGNAYYGQTASFGGNVYREWNRYGALTLQQLLNYSKSFGDNNFDILFGHETYDRQWNTAYGIKYNLFDPESQDLSNAILRQQTGSTSDAYFVEGYFSRLQYNYMQKYFVSASYRRDGSSRFAPENRWGDFWSVGGSWLLNKESFMSGIDAIDFLKFKISYGAQGNDALLTAGLQNYYPYQDQFDIKNSNDDFAIELNYKGNPDITWETSYNFNTGFDFIVLNGLLDGSVEFFNREVQDMLYYIPVPMSAGYDEYPDNIGSMRNRGIEFDLTAKVVKSSKANVSVYMNGTHYKNEILSLPTQFQDSTGYVTGGRNPKILRVGGSIYDYWYPIYAGVNSETGASQWQKIEDDGTVGTTEDYAEASNKANSGSSGTALPDLSGGFGIIADAYGFDFSINFTYSLGGLTYDYVYQQMMHGGEAAEAGTNWHNDILNSWTPENKNTDVPIVDYGGKDAGSSSSRFLVDADYLSINSIILGYTLPKSVTDKLQIGKVRVYGSADNVALFSKRQGLDPRQNFTGATDFIYSPIRRMSVGVKVNF